MILAGPLPPAPLPPPAASLRPSSVRALRLRPALACLTAYVSHATGQIHNPIIIYGLLRPKCDTFYHPMDDGRLNQSHF